MSQFQPQRNPEMPDTGDFVLILDDPGDAPSLPLDPLLRERLERRQQQLREKLLDERCSIAPENLKKLRIVAERLGWSEGDLICKGLDLVIEQHHDKLGDLTNPQPPDDAPKPDNGPPSA